jgi:nucleoid-associated protein YgaU
MNEHAGPACALSGLIVGVFAVLLYEKDEPPPVAKTTARSVVDASPRRVEVPPDGSLPGPKQDHRASPAPPAKSANAPTEVTAVATPAPRPQDAGAAASVREKPPSQPESRPEPAKRPSPALPRPPFTVVESGETLVDVATRIYGSGDSAEALWKANRDQLERIDSELSRGTLLRTP